jgi:thiamine biosynthesis protein ThiS
MTLLPVTVNGATRRVAGGTTLAGLLEELKLDPRLIVVERNGTILRDREAFGTVALEQDDTLEFVHFVGGG